MFTRSTFVLVVLFAALITIQPGWSQESRATLIGRITDSSGSLVPGASIQITNVDTGVTVKTESNEEGNYFSSFLIPGTYRVVAERTGFKRVVRDGITLSVNARLELNLTLEIGALSETVNVTAEASLLDTVNATLGRVVTVEEVRSLPVNFNDVDNLIRLGAGVGFNDEAAKDQPWQSLNMSYTMAGSPASRAQFTLDGAPNVQHDEAAGSIAEAWTPMTDVVSEFKVQTATFDVSTGQTQGAVVNVSLKSGTNRLHGTASYGKQTAGMNANQWVANRVGTPRANINNNTVGVSVGGPVYLPKLYNGKNRTFFLFGLQWVKSVASGGTAGGNVATVPTDAERTGDFSALLKLGSQYQIYDPFSWKPSGTTRYASTPLAGNIIPQNLISPIAQKLISYYPRAEQPGTADGLQNLDRSNWPSRVRYHSLLYKFDHNLSDRNRLMFRMNTNANHNRSVDWFGFDNPSEGAVFWQESAGFAFAENYTFSQKLIMDVRVSDSSYVRAQGPNEFGAGFLLSSLGFPAYLQNAIGPLYREFPTVAVTGYTGFGDRTPLHKMTEARVASVTFFRNQGNHQVKFGAEYQFIPDNRSAGSASTPLSLSFSTTYTKGPLDNSTASPIGQGLAAMLYGIPGGSLTIPSAQDFAASNKMWAGFVQDDWKVTRKLNVNFGLRYERESTMTERWNRSVLGFDPTAAMPFAAVAQANYAKSPTPEISAAQFGSSLVGGVTYAGVGGQPRGLYNPDTNNLMPRAGFAYSPNSKTVIRGGFGVYFGTLGTRQYDPIQSGYSQATNIIASNDNGVTYAATLANPFPTGILQPTGNTLGPLTNVGNSISFFDQNPRAPRSMKYELDIQRALPGQYLVSAGYLGSRGSDLDVSRSLKPFLNQYLSTLPTRDQATINYLSANLTNPFNGIAIFNGTGRSGTTISRSSLLPAYPQYGGVSGTDTYDGKSWYDALNMKFEKRFSHGYLVSLTYTFSKYLNATGLLNGGDAAPYKDLSGQDFTQHVALSAVYELPFGRGRRFLSTVNSAVSKVADVVVGGWETSYIYTYQSGPPVTFGDVIFTGDPATVQLSKDQRNPDHWFNTSVFNRVTAEQLGNHLRTVIPGLTRVRGDAYNSWDMTLRKHVTFHETTQLEFQVNALNVLNQVTFGPPNTSPTSTAFGGITTQRNVPRRIFLQARLSF